MSRPLPKTMWGALLHPWTWRMAWRDSRTQRLRLVIFSLAIVAGISSLVAIHSLRASMQTGIETQAKALLGSDVQINSRQSISDETVAKLAATAQRVSREVSFSSMLYFQATDAARLVQVRAIGGAYPFYGRVETTPKDAWQRMQSEPGILLEPAMLDQFQAKIGDRVKLGSLEMPILGTVEKPAPRSNRFSGFAPEAYVRLADLEGTGLLKTASLASYSLQLELAPGANTKAVKDKIRADYPDDNWRLETPEDRRENLGDALDHFQQFLGIIALSSLVLGAIGVAAAVHAHVNRRVPTIAILRCLGCSGQVAFAIYFAQAGLLALLGAAIGTAVGIGLHTGILTAFHDKLPIDLDASPEWKVALQTAAAGMAVCGGFALLPLLRVRKVSPAATLRDGEALEGKSGGWRAWPVYLGLAALLVGLALLNDRDWKRSMALIGGLAVAFLVLLGAAWALVAVARRIVRPSWPYLLRQGISNLHRPHNQTVLFLLSMGLGTFLLLTVLLAGNLLNQKLEMGRFADSPNIYLVDVQPDQLEGVQGILKEQNLPLLESAPMVTMRIQSVKGVPVKEMEAKSHVPRWVTRREFRSSYRDHLNATETIVAGTWSTKIDGPDTPVPLSLDEQIAKDLKVGIGDEMTLDVQGVAVKAKITSLRKVDWSRFNLNFFMVFPPGVLESAPGFNVVTTKIPENRSSGELQRALVKQYPNVSAIDLKLILDQVRGILSKISAVVSILAGFTVLAGLPILIGILLNGRDVRLKESVLLRTLGASARQVRTILTVEYAALGLLSALTGVVLACGANAGLAILVFKASAWPPVMMLVETFAATTALAVAGGLILSRGVSTHPPLEILRGGN
jgi:putative ABC transport system permease protein